MWGRAEAATHLPSLPTATSPLPATPSHSGVLPTTHWPYLSSVDIVPAHIPPHPTMPLSSWPDDPIASNWSLRFPAEPLRP